MTSLQKNSSFAALLLLSACIVPSHPPPRIDHVQYPMGRIDRNQVGRKQLFVGAATIDMTPPPGAAVWLAGYGFSRRMEHVHDSISAQAIFFDDGTRRVAVVVADVVGLFITSTDRIRRLVGNDIEVVIASTHNHQSPDTMGYWGPSILYSVPVRSGIDPAYLEIFERRMAVAVKRAAESARAAELFVAEAAISDGLVRNLRDPGIYDRVIEIVEARTRTGDVITTFVNFGCHPETLGDRAKLLTADFPGVLRNEIRARRGGVPIFANGILGGMITPDFDSNTSHAERLAFMRRIGEETAEATLDALARARRVAVDEVRYTRERIQLPVENALFRYIARVGLVEARALGEGGAFETEVGLLTIGPLAWAFVPGEPTPAIGTSWKSILAGAGYAHPVVVGLGNDELGYLLTPEQFDDDAYAYEASVSPGRTAGSRITTSLQKLVESSRQ